MEMFCRQEEGIRVMNDQCNVPFFYHCPWSWCLIKWALKGRMLILNACVWRYD